MKTVLLFTLLCLSLQILDRSYYDALCTKKLIKNFQLAQVKKIFEMHSENYPRSIIQIETPAQGKDLKRLMLVRLIVYSLLNTL